MRYVILRDDDTCALTPVECLERLYRPFLERQLPVNLAVIPNVLTQARRSDGRPEGFLLNRPPPASPSVPIHCNRELTDYLLAHPGYAIAQHGYDHTLWEFAEPSRAQVEERLEAGSRLLAQAGLPRPAAFVAPYDKFSPAALRAVSRRFPVVSGGWYEWRRLPRLWWPWYLRAKFQRRPHWRVGRRWLLTHPGCLLSFMHPYGSMLGKIKASIASRRLTVLVTHWWEYFRNGQPDEEFIGVLHATARYLADQPDIRVITFADVAAGRAPAV